MLLLKQIEFLFQRDGCELSGVDLLIEGPQVIAIGTHLTAPPGTRIISGAGKVALPGLINTHHHFFQTMTRCLPGAQDAKLFDWLLYHYPVWRHVTSETIRVAARLAIAELLLTGCTTTADHLYLFPRGAGEDSLEIEISAARELGIRFCGTRGSMTKGEQDGGLPPDSITEKDEDVLIHCEESLRRWHDPSPFSLCQIHLAPCSPFNVTAELMQESAILARKYGVRLHTHLAETQDEEDYCREVYHRRPLEFMEDLGWIGPDVWFAHGIFFSDVELDRLAAANTGISHCPSSNMRLGSGVAKVPAMLARGVPVGLAVDGSASNDSSDMLGEIRQALLLHRVISGSHVLSARQAISLATMGSAQLLGREKLGEIQEGMAADLVLFDVDRLPFAGAKDLVASLIFCGFDHRVHTSIINGEIVVENGALIRADEEQIKREAQQEAKRLWKRAGVL